MKKLITLIAALSILTACQESIEERAERESRQYTEKFCPTPPQNDVITDSLVFDRATRTQKYYVTFTGVIDDADAISEHADDIRVQLLESIRNNTSMKAYKEASFNFEYICRSLKQPGHVHLHLVYKPKDYQ